MNWECLCNFAVSNAERLRQALSNQDRQSFCDESGCYDTGKIIDTI